MKRIYILLIAVFSLGMGGCNYVDVDANGLTDQADAGDSG